MRFDDPRTEWRINDLERSVRNKAESYEVAALISNVHGLEHSCRALSSCIDELRTELQRCQDKITDMESLIEASNR